MEIFTKSFHNRAVLAEPSIRQAAQEIYSEIRQLSDADAVISKAESLLKNSEHHQLKQVVDKGASHYFAALFNKTKLALFYRERLRKIAQLKSAYPQTFNVKHWLGSTICSSDRLQNQDQQKNFFRLCPASWPKFFGLLKTKAKVEKSKYAVYPHMSSPTDKLMQNILRVEANITGESEPYSQYSWIEATKGYIEEVLNKGKIHTKKIKQDSQQLVLLLTKQLELLEKIEDPNQSTTEENQKLQSLQKQIKSILSRWKNILKFRNVELKAKLNPSMEQIRFVNDLSDINYKLKSPQVLERKDIEQFLNTHEMQPQLSHDLIVDVCAKLTDWLDKTSDTAITNQLTTPQKEDLEQIFLCFIKQWQDLIKKKTCRKPEVQVPIPYAGANQAPFGLLMAGVQQRRQEYTTSASYFKLLSQAHNCSGSTIKIAQAGLLNCYVENDGYYTFGYGGYITPAKAVEVIAEAAFKIDCLNNQYKQLSKEYLYPQTYLRTDGYTPKLGQDRQLQLLLDNYSKLKSAKNGVIKKSLQLKQLIKLIERCHAKRYQLRADAKAVQYILAEIDDFFKANSDPTSAPGYKYSAENQLGAFR